MPSQPESFSRAIGHRIVRASAAVVLAHCLFKIVGVIQAAVMARYIDRSVLDAIYVFAFEGCIFNFFLTGEEAIGPSFLPVFVKELNDRGEPWAWRFANAVLTILLLVVAAVVVAIVVGRDLIIGVFTAWDPVRNREAWALGRQALLWLAPAFVGLSVGSVTYLILNGYKRFFLAAVGEAAWKICALAGVVLGVGVFGWDYRALLAGLLAGSLAKVATHLAGMPKEARFFRISFDWRSDAVKAMGLLVLPLIVGIVFAKVRDIYNNVYILSYLDTPGLMLANSFGRKLANTINFLVPYAISIAAFPFFCDLVVRAEKERLGKLLTESSRMILSVMLPLALVVGVLAWPLTALIFHGGKFGTDDVHRTAISTACYILVLPATVVETLLMRVFWANRLMISVTVIGLVYAGLSMALSGWGILTMGWRGTAALMAVALGVVVSRALKAVTLAAWLQKRHGIPTLPLGETLVFLLRTTLVGVTAAAAGWTCGFGYEAALGHGLGKVLLAGKLAFAGAGALGGFVLAARLLRLREPADMLRWALARIKRGKGEPARVGE